MMAEVLPTGSAVTVALHAIVATAAHATLTRILIRKFPLEELSQKIRRTRPTRQRQIKGSERKLSPNPRNF
jgi:hypothetical protein